MSTVPSHAICVAMYYDTDPSQICRITAIVTRLDTSQTVERLEAWGQTDMESIADRIGKLGPKYGVEVTLLSQPVPLEPCCHSPNREGYFDRVITRQDWLGAHTVKRRSSTSRR